jgi:hypothetical protein
MYFLGHYTEGVKDCVHTHTHGVAVDTYTSLVLCLFLIYYNGCDDLIGMGGTYYSTPVIDTQQSSVWKHSEIN